MNKRVGIFVSFFLGAILAVCGEEAAGGRHAIDVTMEKSIEKNPSTMGMVEAVSEAQKKWEGEIAAGLKQLHQQMEPGEWEALELSQRAWTVFRDNEIKAKRELYSRMDGSMWRPAAASSIMGLYRARALELKSYLETLAER